METESQVQQFELTLQYIAVIRTRSSATAEIACDADVGAHRLSL